MRTLWLVKTVGAGCEYLPDHGSNFRIGAYVRRQEHI